MSFETFDLTPSATRGPKPAQPPVGFWAIILASLVGSMCLILADILKNPVPATTEIAKYAKVRIPNIDVATLEFFAILLMMLIGLGLCFVFRPKSLPGAFGRSSGLHAVLFGINTFGGLAGPALAGAVFSPGPAALPVTYSLETPEAYGPLGLGTRITGRSSARAFEVMVPMGFEISDCIDTQEVGEGVFCSVLRRDAELLLNIELPNGRAPVWIQINTDGWRAN